MTKTNQPASSKPVMMRLPRETFDALQLSLPFVQRSSAQEVLRVFIEAYLEDLAAADPGFERALQGLRESAALRDGVLARRTLRKGQAHA